ncbi:MAG: phosphatidylserine decarboxylase family protein [Bacteroidales bacterium]|jgi:phosphatidylserine decarboxylase|nr:phosphatidylserine decarboxylase family protein [Bacteroidales bacterium]
MKIHEEGKKIILSVLSFAVLTALIINIFHSTQTVWHIVGYVALLLLLLFILRFFRVPKRKTNVSPNKILSACDGKVVVIEEVYEKEFFKDKRILVSVFMSTNNVHINWFPISGRVSYVKYHPGKKLVAWHPKSSEKNERSTVVIKTENDKEVLMRQIAGAVACRIVCYPKEGDKAIQGEEMGFIKFGSRIDIFLPLNAKVNVNLKDRVKGKQTILAEL